MTRSSNIAVAYVLLALVMSGCVATKDMEVIKAAHRSDIEALQQRIAELRRELETNKLGLSELSVNVDQRFGSMTSELNESAAQERERIRTGEASFNQDIVRLSRALELVDLASTFNRRWSVPIAYQESCAASLGLKSAGTDGTTAGGRSGAHSMEFLSSPLQAQGSLLRSLASVNARWSYGISHFDVTLSVPQEVVLGIDEFAAHEVIPATITVVEATPKSEAKTHVCTLKPVVKEGRAALEIQVGTDKFLLAPSLGERP